MIPEKYLKEIECLRNVFLPWIKLFVFLTVFFFTFGLKSVSIFDRVLAVPYPGIDSISALFFKQIKHDLLPPDIQVIVVNPLNALLIQLEIAFFLAFIFSLPLFLLKLFEYISPALYAREKKMLIKSVLPSAILFFSGVAFSYFVFIPFTIKLFYSYVIAIGAVPFFDVGEFVSFVLRMCIAVGITFLLPVFMTALTQIGIVDRKFWKDNWRYAFFVFIVFGAIITPDGSGITQLMIAVPMMLLYALGYIFSKKKTI